MNLDENGSDSDSNSDAENDDRMNVVVAAVKELFPVLLQRNEPTPRNNSVHTAKMRLAELMDPGIHPGTFRDQARMNQPTFIALCNVLRARTQMRDKRDTTVEENLMLFLRHGMVGDSNRSTQFQKQRSADTISKAVNEVADHILSIQPYFIRPPLPHTGPNPLVSGRPKFSPYFDDFDGGVDGTHVPAVVTAAQAPVFRNRKGWTSQNVLTYFSFNCDVLYLHAGWEGTAHDAQVLTDALQHGFPRQGRKLVDAAYTQTWEFIKPFRGVRYNLNEWGPAEQRPQNYRELFNLRHAQMRNCAERGIGICKKRFPILSNMLQ